MCRKATRCQQDLGSATFRLMSAASSILCHLDTPKDKRKPTWKRCEENCLRLKQIHKHKCCKTNKRRSESIIIIIIIIITITTTVSLIITFIITFASFPLSLSLSPPDPFVCLFWLLAGSPRVYLSDKPAGKCQIHCWFEFHFFSSVSVCFLSISLIFLSLQCSPSFRQSAQLQRQSLTVSKPRNSHNYKQTMVERWDKDTSRKDAQTTQTTSFSMVGPSSDVYEYIIYQSSVHQLIGHQLKWATCSWWPVDKKVRRAEAESQRWKSHSLVGTFTRWHTSRWLRSALLPLSSSHWPQLHSLRR